VRFAAISDILGNLTAMESVLEEIDKLEQPVDRIVCAGDVVGLGPHPNEVIELLRERSIESVKGNYDDAVARGTFNSGMDFPDTEAERLDRLALDWTRRVLTASNLRYLSELPREVRLFGVGSRTGIKRLEQDEEIAEYRRTFMSRALFGNLVRPRPRRPGRIPNRRVLLVHASPRALNEFIRPDTANSLLDSIVRASNRADVIISGHSGVGYQREADKTTFIGVGSLSGRSASPGRAEYAVITIEQQIEVDLGVVHYDAASHARSGVERGMPPDLARRIEVPSP
jgi:predicted phosphodiesterase